MVRHNLSKSNSRFKKLSRDEKIREYQAMCVQMADLPDECQEELGQSFRKVVRSQFQNKKQVFRRRKKTTSKRVSVCQNFSTPRRNCEEGRVTTSPPELRTIFESNFERPSKIHDDHSDIEEKILMLYRQKAERRRLRKYQKRLKKHISNPDILFSTPIKNKKRRKREERRKNMRFLERLKTVVKSMEDSDNDSSSSEESEDSEQENKNPRNIGISLPISNIEIAISTSEKEEEEKSPSPQRKESKQKEIKKRSDPKHDFVAGCWVHRTGSSSLSTRKRQ